MKRFSRALLTVLLALPLTGCVGLDFSPDGQNVAVTTPRGIVIMPVDGGPQQLIPDSKEGYLPLWSPNSHHILYLRPANNNKSELMLFDKTANISRRMGSGWGWPYVW